MGWRRALTLKLAAVVVAVGLSAFAWWCFGESTTIGLATVAAPIVAIILWLLSSDSITINPDDLTDIVEYLATTVRQQWEDEANTRDLRDPLPITIAWHEADAELMDRRENMVAARGAGWLSRLIPNRQLVLTGRTDQLLNWFQLLPRQRVVLTGNAGSGKTTVLLLLTLELLEARTRGQPVPLLLSLAAWDPIHEPFLEWLPRHIAEEYPILAKNRRARRLLVDRLIIPLLDGLDELPGHLPGEALKAINRASSYQPIVIACRHDEYSRAVSESAVLSAAAVVHLESITSNHAADFLRRTGARGRRSLNWQPVLDALRRGTHPALTGAMSTPLVVSMARTVYGSNHHLDPRELLNPTLYPTSEAIEDHLLDTLVLNAVVRRRSDKSIPRRWQPEHVQRWLQWLATHLRRRGVHDFAWWGLPSSNRLVHAVQGFLAGALSAVTASVLAGLGFSLVVSLNGVLIVWSSGVSPWVETARDATVWLLPPAADPTLAFSVFGFVLGLPLAFALGVLAGVMAAWTPRPMPSHAAPSGVWSLSRALRGGCGALVLFAVVIALELGLQTTYNDVLDPQFLAALPAIAVPGILFSALAGFVQELDLPMTPRTSLRGDRVLVLVTFPFLSILTLITMLEEKTLFPVGPVSFFLDPLHTVLFVNIWLQGWLVTVIPRAWTWYQMARLYRAVRGELPWRTMTFLEDCYRLGILRRVGSVYQFRHARLQDRLAAQPVELSVVSR